MIKYKKTTNTNSRSVVAMISKQSRSKGKQQGREYTSQKYFMRYMANYWMIKGEYQQNGLINC